MVSNLVSRALFPHLRSPRPGDEVVWIAQQIQNIARMGKLGED